MNELFDKLLSDSKAWRPAGYPSAEGGDAAWKDTIIFNNEEHLKQFVDLVVRECLSLCNQVAIDADTIAKSKFVTDAGRQLHEGMWGGAYNCGALIKEHFGVE